MLSLQDTNPFRCCLKLVVQPYHEVDEGNELYFIHVTFQPCL